jgi:hypothetical protein
MTPARAEQLRRGKAAERARKKAAGLVLLSQWVPADKLDACKAAVAEAVRRITEGEDE